MALESCKILITVLDERISHLGDISSLTSRALFLWEEQGMNNYSTLLSNQVSGLHLLLTASQW